MRYNESSFKLKRVQKIILATLIILLSIGIFLFINNKEPNLTGINHKTVSLFDYKDLHEIHLGDYTMKVEEELETNTVRSVPDKIWKRLRVLMDGKVVYEVDAQEVEPYGYKLVGYDEYKINDSVYYLFQDWNGAMMECCSQAISLIFKDNKFQYGKIWEPVNSSEYDDDEYKEEIIRLLER